MAPSIDPNQARPRALLVYVTAPSETEAHHLARTVVEERLAACANIIAHITSVYRWKGAVQSDPELVVLFKTTSERAEQLTQRVIELHSYETPCVVALPVVAGAEPFIRWIASETGE